MQRQKLIIVTVIAVVAVSAVSAGQQHRTNRLTARVDSMAVTLTALASTSRGSKSSAPRSATVFAPDRAVAGNPAAPVTIVEFLDYECPFCRKHSRETFPAIRSKYIDNQRVRYVVRHLPLPMHPNAAHAAAVSICAAKRDATRFWSLHEAMLASDSTLTFGYLMRLASDVGFNTEELSRCSYQKETLNEVAEDQKAAQNIGINGTPTFVIGALDHSSRVRGEVIGGAASINQFDDVLQRASTKQLPTKESK